MITRLARTFVFSVGSLRDVFGMVASATDALSESVHGMALALYGFLFRVRGLFWMNFGSSGCPLASILRAQGSQKWSLGRFGVHFEYPKASKSRLWGARGFFLDRWRLQGGLQGENTTFFPSNLGSFWVHFGVKQRIQIRVEIWSTF